jgi:hypothetical protein
MRATIICAVMALAPAAAGAENSRDKTWEELAAEKRAYCRFARPRHGAPISIPER